MSHTGYSPRRLSVSPVHYQCVRLILHFPPPLPPSPSFLSHSVTPPPLTPPSLLQVCEVDRRHSFRRSALVCHDVIAVATRQTVSRYAQTHQAPDPNPDTHTHTHLRGLSAAFDHLRPLVLSETLMPGLRSLTYFHTHTHTPKQLPVCAALSPSCCHSLLCACVCVQVTVVCLCLGAACLPAGTCVCVCVLMKMYFMCTLVCVNVHKLSVCIHGFSLCIQVS